MVPALPLGGTVVSQTSPAQGAKLHPHAENAVRRDEEPQRQTHTVGGKKKQNTPYPAEQMFTLMVLKPSDENHPEDDEDRQIRM